MEGNTRYTVASLVTDLKNVVKSEGEMGRNGTTNLTEILNSLTQETSIEEFIPIEILLVLLRDKSKQIVAIAAKAIAEIGKTEKGREIYTNANIVDVLINLLQEEDINILTQASRALGNICYENANGKILVRERNGFQTIIAILEKTINLRNIDGMNTLRKVTTGLLLNFLVDQPSIKKQELKDMVVPIVYNVLEIDGLSGQDTVSHVLLILGLLSDAGIIVLNEKLAKIIINILESDTSLEVLEMCLELLYDQAEEDKVKVILVQVGIPELLLDLIETAKLNSTDKEAKSVLKVAYNLIILILTGDESMNLLYNESHGTVYKRLVKWLDHEDEQFQVTAISAIGNFARSDIHCSLMVAQGVHKQLLKLLQKKDSLNSDIRFQHALLSALRNLAIPADNKVIMLKDGLIEALYPTLNIPTFPVVFRLLGTLRMAIDGQKEAAISLGSREDFIKRVVEWCNTDDHLGVQSEATRLLAWLINNSKNKSVALLIIKYDGVQHLAKMMLTQHAVMQNEAILSLTILATSCLTELETYLVEIEIGRTISNFFEENACNLDSPILFNALTLINNMIKSDVLKQHLRNVNLVTALEKASLAKCRKNSDLNERIKAVYVAIES